VLWGLVLLSLCAVAFFILLCIWGWGPHQGANANYALVPTKAIVNQPKDYRGKAVEVSGIVDDVLTPQQFVLGGEKYAGALLVFTPQSTLPPNSAALAKGDLAQVEGHVRLFNRGNWEKQYNVKLPADVYAAREGKPAIVADRWMLMAPVAQVSATK
jgi:hypothetical protein